MDDAGDRLELNPGFPVFLRLLASDGAQPATQALSPVWIVCILNGSGCVSLEYKDSIKWENQMLSEQKSDVLYLDDVQVGNAFFSAEHHLDKQQIMDFAGEFDPQPFHLDETLAQDTVFKGLAASGWHTAAITMKLIVESVPFADGIIGAGGEISWPRPTRSDDILHVETRITDIRPSRSKSNQGIVTIKSLTKNRDGEILQKLVASIVLFKRSD